MNNIKLNEDILEEVKLNEINCIDCKKCFNSCPMMKEYSSSPKTLMKNIIECETVDENIPYSCMLCEVCNVKCTQNINLKNMFYNIRKDIFINNPKKLKKLGYNTVKFHQINSFSSLFSKTFLNKNTKRLFLPGCSLSSYSSDLVLKTFKYLQGNIEDIALVFQCCGKPTLSMGDVDTFKKYYSKLEKIFNNEDIEEIIVACPNCFSTIKSNSKNIKVTSIWETIREYGIPENLINHYKDLDKSFSLHDPCPIRYEYQIHDDVRYILNSLGVKILEFDKNRENSECCGSGGMVRITNISISENQSNKRANEAKTDNVISYCQSCCESMIIANKPTLHILDLIFNDSVVNKEKFSQYKTTTINKWAMRYKGIKLAKSSNIKEGKI